MYENDTVPVKPDTTGVLNVTADEDDVCTTGQLTVIGSAGWGKMKKEVSVSRGIFDHQYVG